MVSSYTEIKRRDELPFECRETTQPQPTNVGDIKGLPTDIEVSMLYDILKD